MSKVTPHMQSPSDYHMFDKDERVGYHYTLQPFHISYTHAPGMNPMRRKSAPY